MSGDTTVAESTTDARFALFATKMQQAQLAPIVIDNFQHYYSALLAGQTGLIPEDEIVPVETLPQLADLAAYAEQGRRALGRAAILKLNGGLGTSMGLDQAKSLLPVRDGLSFLDIVARQVLHLRETSDRYIPLIMMDSFNTDVDTQAVLANYPALEGALPLTMLQNKIPKIDQKTLLPIEWSAEPDLEWCPPGHGEVYIALQTSGLLQQLLAQGIEYLFLSNVDNLAATLDPSLLGYMMAERVPFLMEVAERTAADRKGGHLAQRRDGGLLLREIAQCPTDDLDAFQDIRRYRFFNTNNIWVHLPTLRDTLHAHHNVLQLPMIRNAKTVDPKNPNSPAVYQLETAMGAAIATFAGARAICVPRSRFMPVKLCSDLLVLRSDAYLLGADYTLYQNPVRVGPPPVADLDAHYRLVTDFESRFPEGVPSLVACQRLQVRGDVLFEGGIVLAGDVTIINPTDAQQRLPAATKLSDSTFSFTETAQNAVEKEL